MMIVIETIPVETALEVVYIVCLYHYCMHFVLTYCESFESDLW